MLSHTNPSTEAVVDFETTPLDELSSLVEATRSAQESWRAVALSERVKILKLHDQAIHSYAEELAQAMSEDMGKPLKAAKAEVLRTKDSANYLLERAEEWLAPEARDCGRIFYEPLGLAAAITPWNAPLVISMFQIVPSLIAGNGVIWKPSEYTPRVSLLYYQLLQEILPRDILQQVIGGKEHGQRLLDYEFQFLSFTGSTATGGWIAEKVSKNFTRLQLELGGVDAAIVLGDVDIEECAESIVRINAINSGQICCSIKRVYVEERIAQAFTEAAARASKKIVVGDPFTDPDMGPLSSKMQLEKCEYYLRDALAQGAKVLSGGKRIGQKGYFFEHTVLTDLNPSILLLKEEAFAPILPIISIKDIEEGVKLTNSLPFALSASIWGKDAEAMNNLALKLDAGVVGINRHGVPPVGCPWGGAKHSGLGRGRSIEGLRENCNLKFVYGQPSL